MNEDVIETAGPYRVRLEVDQHERNPRRENDCYLGHVVTVPSSNYEDVDEDGGPLADGWNRIKDRDDAMELFERWARIFHGAVTDTFTPHDGPNSVWYMLPEQAKEVGSGTTPLKYLQGEIEEYRAWRDGEVYGYIIEKSVTWVPKENGHEDEIPDEMDTWETVEDCWGYIGREYAEESAKEAFTYYKDKAEKA